MSSKDKIIVEVNRMFEDHPVGTECVYSLLYFPAQIPLAPDTSAQDYGRHPTN